MKYQESIEIAKTIQNQLVGTVGRTVIWSWGQSALQVVSSNFLEKWNIKGFGALKFRVQGKFFKGNVLVVLNGKDLYDVYLCNIRKGEIKIHHERKNLYFDEFGEWIDEMVESKGVKE